MYSRGRLEKSADSADLAKRVDKLLYDEVHRVYVGVTEEALLLINTEFQCVYECVVERSVLHAVINPWTGEVITGGPGHITVRVTSVTSVQYHKTSI